VIHVEIQVLGHESPYSMTELGSFLVSRAVNPETSLTLDFLKRNHFGQDYHIMII
jgi:hypothetical protein